MAIFRRTRRYGCAAFLAMLILGANGRAAPTAPYVAPPGAGRDIFLRVCSACHDPRFASFQRLDEPGWRAAVLRMRQRGATITAAEERAIVAYLARAFPDAPGSVPRR